LVSSPGIVEEIVRKRLAYRLTLCRGGGGIFFFGKFKTRWEGGPKPGATKREGGGRLACVGLPGFQERGEKGDGFLGVSCSRRG